MTAASGSRTNQEIGEITLRIERETDVVLACQKGRSLAARLGFDAIDQVAVAIIISEVVRNILVHAGHGQITFQPVSRNGSECCGLLIVARDQGPGIADIELALQDGYSTGGGLGVGLSAARRLADEFQITSQPGLGTTVAITKWLP